MNLKLKSGYMLSEVAGNYLVVPVGEATMDFSGIINLNEVGAFIWKQLENGTTMEELIKAVTAEYEVSEEIAAKDANAFVEKLRGADLLA